ncbi:BCCT transporter [Acidaminobacter sp. JC074]|uniref:BCCT family transporter n=1 Tax=Acidaminobacter sp. JC074 TaxID=2530199 RepID=UPI001F10B772|nr:BCCT family transporter [Acidaminobacter sp. JC074]MCH4887830.1 BCCT transporter [Acidaminobacter sp. JC074]
MKKLRLSMISVPIIIFVGVIIASMINADVATSSITNVYLWMASQFGWFAQLACFIFLVSVMVIAFSKVGRIKFGGRDAKPELSTWAYFTIALCAGIGTGIMFWGPIEPLYFSQALPEGVNLVPGSPEAIQFAMNKAFMHWTFTPYALYVLCGFGIAYAMYNMKLPQAVSSGMALLFGEKFLESKWRTVVDAIALTAICSGLAGGLANGLIQLGAGLEMISGIQSGPAIWIMFAVVITTIYTISSASGLQKGIKWLSDKNAWIFIVFLLITLFSGPTKFLMELTVNSFGGYLNNFVSSSIFLAPGTSDMWVEWWDTFYLADWLSFSPVIGLFLARISYGRTIREFVLINLIAPAMFGVLWFGVFGGFAINLMESGTFDMFSYMTTVGFDGVMLKLAEFLPLGQIIQPLIIVTVMLSYITMADSMTSSISLMSLKDNIGVKEAPLLVKVFWGSLMGALAVIFVTAGGINGMKTLLAISGFPVLIIMCFLFAGIIKRLVIDKNYSMDEVVEPKPIGLKDKNLDKVIMTETEIKEA